MSPRAKRLLKLHKLANSTPHIYPLPSNQDSSFEQDSLVHDSDDHSSSPSKTKPHDSDDHEEI
jgi:hypothetical protein